MASVYLDEDGCYQLAYIEQNRITIVELRGPNYYIDENKLYIVDYSNYSSDIIIYIISQDGSLINKRVYEYTDIITQHYGFIYILINDCKKQQGFIYRDNELIWQIDGAMINLSSMDDNMSFMANSDRYLIGIDGIVKHVQE